jgi:hypothetical protein
MTVGTYTAGLALGGAIERWVGTSAANTAQTISTSTGGVARRLLWVSVLYSAAPTETGVIVTLNSGAGAGYDTPLKTFAANTQANFFPLYTDPETVVILADDAIDVLAPAAGGVITSTIIIYTKKLTQ